MDSLEVLAHFNWKKKEKVEIKQQCLQVFSTPNVVVTETGQHFWKSVKLVQYNQVQLHFY